MGWLQEPAFTGSANSVQVVVSDLSGVPVSRADAALTVQVSFGSARVTLPLLPVKAPGELRAELIPTEPGTYAFHVTGTVLSRAIDVAATCSDRTFSCVAAASDVQFPAKDPSNVEIADGLARALARAQRATDAASNARTIAIAAIVLAALVLAAGAGAGLRARRRRARE
jgi:hypothetical protein